MSPLRIVIASALIACIAALAVFALMDRAMPISITIAPLPHEPMRVAVSGAVATPGVVTVPAGARLSDVASAAGGFADDADYSGLNLAGRVGDGEQIVIPRIASAPDQMANGPKPVKDVIVDPGPLNLNVASSKELEDLPGIGEVLAGRIVSYREEHGPFAAVEELVHIDGISQRLLEQLLPLITVNDGG